MQTATAIRQQRIKQQQKKQRKIDRLRLFTLKHVLLKISVHLQTAFPAETQWLEEQRNVVKLRIVACRAVTVRRPRGK
jgi:hypothetical protein